MSTRHGIAVVSLPADCEILIARQFEAPRALVWELMTNPRHVIRWWGPSWCPLVSCDVDFRVGGAWRYVSLMDNAELVWRGTYLEIAAGTRIVSTECFEGFPDAESKNTITLTESEGVTTMQTRVVHLNKEFRDGHIASGMEGGMQETFNRLEDMLHNAGSPAERFRRVAGRFTDRANEVSAAAWNNDAPCDGWTARDVVKHMIEWMPSLLRAADVRIDIDIDVVADPAGAWNSLAEQLQEVLDDPTVAEREFDAGPPGRMSVASAIDMLMLGDIVIHTWDLARAAGLDESLDPVLAEAMYEGMQPIDEILRSSGHYGPKVAVADDADVTTKLIAFTGRTP